MKLASDRSRCCDPGPDRQCIRPGHHVRKGKISYYLGYQQGSALAELTGRGSSWI